MNEQTIDWTNDQLKATNEWSNELTLDRTNVRSYKQMNEQQNKR